MGILRFLHRRIKGHVTDSQGLIQGRNHIFIFPYPHKKLWEWRWVRSFSLHCMRVEKLNRGKMRKMMQDSTCIVTFHQTWSSVKVE